SRNAARFTLAEWELRIAAHCIVTRNPAGNVAADTRKDAKESAYDGTRHHRARKLLPLTEGEINRAHCALGNAFALLSGRFSEQVSFRHREETDQNRQHRNAFEQSNLIEGEARHAADR